MRHGGHEADRGRGRGRLAVLCGGAAVAALACGPAAAAPPPVVGPALATATAIAGEAGIPLPSLYGPQTAIVILGYGLLPDGSVRPELVDRLRAGLIAAVASPASPIIVTGGNPQNGTTEADAMARWLIGRGVPAERVLLDRDARTTVENATGAARTMAGAGVRDAVLITSADHLPRAAADFAHDGIALAATLAPEQIPGPLLSQL
jgi:uncharacterized SAM-binding protein YcdF (DUF218 family)